MNRIALALVFLAATLAAGAFAQQPATGATVVASEPGKAVIAQTAEVSAKVVAIDKATRTVTLKGPQGNVVDVVAGDEVRNFDQIKLGDIRGRALPSGAHARAQEDQGRGRGAHGRQEDGAGETGRSAGRCRGASGHRDRGRHRRGSGEEDDHAQGAATATSSLLDVQNPAQFKVVKKGDQVEVTYTEALALSWRPRRNPLRRRRRSNRPGAIHGSKGLQRCRPFFFDEAVLGRPMSRSGERALTT